MHTFSRREFVSALSLGTGYVLWGNPLAAGTAGPPASPFDLVRLGDSGIATTMLGIGMGFHGGDRSSALTRQDRAKALGVVQHAYDVGIRFFDNADSYGTHGLMAEALRTIPREEVTICSKIWTRPGGIPEAERPDADVVVDRFRRELNTDYLDLVQLHCMVAPDWTERERRQMDLLDDLKGRGVIKAHGVSVHTWEAMKAAVESPWVDVLHARINPYGIAMDRPEPAEVLALLHRLHDDGKGVIGMKLIGGGEYPQDPERIDNALRFVLELGSVDMVIVGFEHTEQVDDYAERFQETLTRLQPA